MTKTTFSSTRKWILTLLVAFMSIGLLLTGCGQSTQQGPETRVIVDKSGKEITIPYTVDKVAPTIGAFAHITSILGGSEKIAASIPDLSKTFKNVFPKANPENHNTENIEDIIASGAQVTYGPSYTDEQISQLEAAGVAVVTLNTFSNAEEMKENVNLIAEILGGDAPEKAEAFNKRYDENIAYVEGKTKDLTEDEKVKVLCVRFGGGNYTTVNQKDISSFYAEAAGGIVSSATYEGEGQGTSMTVSAEQIVSWSPDVIFTMSNEGKDQMLSDPALATVPAVKDGKVFVTPTGTYPWSVRSAEGALMPFFLGKIMYPDLFSALNLEEKTKEFYKTFYDYDLSDDELAEILKGR